jgi:hypothetical protein
MGTWSAAATMVLARGDHGASVLLNGSVLVSGGYNNGYLSDAELYAGTADGASCTDPTDCLSAFCVGGVCCETACAGGTCMSGVCTPPTTTSSSGGNVDVLPGCACVPGSLSDNRGTPGGLAFGALALALASGRRRRERTERQ